MRGNSVIAVTAKKEIQTSLTLHTQTAATVTRSFYWLPKVKALNHRGESRVSSNTLQDGVGELDKGSRPAGVKHLLAFGLMFSGLRWPKVNWRPPSRADLAGPPLLTGHANIIIETPTPSYPTAKICTLSLSASIEKSKHEAANSNDPVLSQPARKSVLELWGERWVSWRRLEGIA